MKAIIKKIATPSPSPTGGSLIQIGLNASSVGNSHKLQS
jgi:hypothetical protein